jgi:hypothetical protein
MFSLPLFRTLAVLLVVVAAAGCRDELPTAVGPDHFPEGALLTSLVLDMPTGEFAELIGQFSGYTDPSVVPFLLVANEFNGGLQARALLRFPGFPDSVVYTVAGTTVVDSVFTYSTGVLVAPVDTAASAWDGSVTLRLHALLQEWDPRSVSWHFASDTAEAVVPWAQPGGALGVELGRVTWTPADTLQQDSIRWEVDSLAVNMMAQEDFAGVAVVAESPGSRLQLGPFTLRTGVRPETHPDTVLAQVIAGQPDSFIFTPDPPLDQEGWHAGGVLSARTLFRLTLPDSVAGCPAGAGCPRRALREVTLNEVSLVMQPLAVGSGFRPLRPVTMRLRRIGEPGLGRRAPLGTVVAEEPGAPALFATPGDTTVAFNFTNFAVGLLAQDTLVARPSTALALLVEPGGAAFGHVRFAANPRLRIVYTLPVQRNPQ